MVKQNICETANEALKGYNDALTLNNALQIKNETAKKRAEKVKICSDHFQFICHIFNWNLCSSANTFYFLDGDRIGRISKEVTSDS